VFLCGALLARNPMDRPGEAALTAGPGNDPLHHGVASERGNASLEREPLIGRDAELAQIRLAYQGTLSGQAVIMFVSGESGIGKSALMQAFLNELRGQGHATVLAGRCYERENVPFKGFDSLVDDLSRHLRKLPPTESAAVMPREVFALARIFPVLDRIDAVAEAPVKQVTDPQELKRRAFDALGELLARMRDRGPLVLFIDDAQWLDQDSVRLARALFLYKEAAPLLLVYTHRSEGAEHNVLLQTVLQAARDSAKFTVRDVRVGPLPRAALRTLAERLLPPHTQAHSDALAIEAQGSPFFAAELARAACVRDLTKSPSLAEALSVHVGALPIGARRILSLLALAGQPLSVDVVVEATGTEDGHANLDRLRGEQLVRVSIDADGARSIECYHDKIREYLAGGLDPLHARELALGLARALSALPAANNELIARMLDLAGLPVEAAVHVAHAAEAAFAALAFERSARLFAQAVEHGRFEPERLQALRIGHAEALAHAGRAEAAEAYLSAAEHASADDAHELERKAGEQYLLHGELARGRLLMDRALRRVGHSLPQSLGGALASVIWSRGRVRVRGHSFAERAQHDAGTLRELELLRLTAHCLYRSDQLRGADFSARFLRRALDAGHAVEIARALTLEILFRSMSGAPAKHIEAAKALCSELCERTGDRLATTWLYVFRGADTLLRLSQPDEALTDLDRCLAMLAGESLHATGHDRAWVQYFRAVCLWQGGRIAEAGELAGAQLEDALARGDHTAAGGLMSIFCYGLMARERTDQAERILEEARARLLPGEVNVQHAQWIVARWVIGAYAGRILETWTQTAECRGRFFGSWQGRVMLADLQRPIAASMAAAAALAAKEPEQRRALRQQARGFIRGTKNAIPSSITLVPTHALLACLEGDRERAVTALRQSLASPGGLLSNHLFRRRLGELLGGDEGAALIAEADAFLHAGGVVDPARYTAALVPGIALVSES
jgi:hypothetical protein